MKKAIGLVLFITICTACNVNNKDLGETDSGLLDTNQGQRTDEILVESTREVKFNEDNNEFTPTEAEQLVRRKLGLSQSRHVVQYVNKEEDKYIIHVYSLSENDNKNNGWYNVDPKTQVVEKLKH
ncbi:hypothetical protein [Metabacillus arenae]|uniref:Uncharacterized protein n=1 Tax=Metabacillus arenae TaxID=2771434 RepID=A0A926NK92_9BACI|nr:hypothetical protein [Metabacillus arenae]MBD1383319.1 hypothetical protein [Metabacillus arenae]